MTEIQKTAWVLQTAAPSGFDNLPILLPDEKTAERPCGAENIYLFTQDKFPIAHPAVLHKLFKIFLIDFRYMIFRISEVVFILCQGMKRADILPEFRISPVCWRENSTSDSDEDSGKDAGKQQPPHTFHESGGRQSRRFATRSGKPGQRSNQKHIKNMAKKHCEGIGIIKAPVIMIADIQSSHNLFRSEQQAIALIEVACSDNQ